MLMRKNSSDHTLTRTEGLLKRYQGNPIITPKNMPGTTAIFNCGQTTMDDETILLLAVIPRDGVPAMHVARSKDGIEFEIEQKPFISQLQEGPWEEFDIWCIDPRITKIENTYYIVRPMEPPLGPIAALEKTNDFVTREFIECISLPCNRVPCLFPEKIDGKYYRLDRPFAPGGTEQGEIWLSSSPDLIHWGCHRRVQGSTMSNIWAKTKIGPTPPIKTEQGWLEIIHGVHTSCAGSRYSIGALLLDLDDPCKIVGSSKGWLLTPDTLYECTGNVPNVVFPCGAIADFEKDRLRVYYGAADTCIGLATGSISEIINDCLK